MSFKPNFCTITKCSHHFVVKNPTPQITQAIYNLSSQYTQCGLEFDKIRKKKVWRPLKTYAIYVDHGHEFRFHIGQFREFFDLLNSNFIDPNSYEIVEKPMYEAADAEFKIREGWELYPEQAAAVEFATDPIDGNNAPLIMMPTGTGKAQPLDAHIKIPDNWSFMRDIKAGDIVISKDGSKTEVTGVFPQGEIDTYRITFEDGRSTECSIDHLWKIYIRTKEKYEKVVKTSDIIYYLSKNTYKNRCYVDLPDPEDSIDKELILDPYTLGLFLGDGCLKERSIILITPDSEILDYLEKTMPEGLSLRHDHQHHKYAYYVTRGLDSSSPNQYVGFFRELGLLGKRSYEKFIPDEYLHGSLKQRLELIRGLMDTDGTVDHKSGTPSYSTSSEILAHQVQYLIRSIGGLAKISSRYTTYPYKGEILSSRLNYNVTIRYRKPSELFTLPRKKKLTNDNNQYAKSLKLRIRSIDYVGKKESQCISVSHPDKLYITNDFIPTHNTVTSLFAASKMGKRLAVLVLSGYVKKWVKDLNEIYDLEPKDIVEIDSGDVLKRCTHFPGSGLDTPKIFVISVNTMSVWYKHYEADINNPILDEYGCKPYDFFEHLGIGGIIFDEVHQHPHAIFRAHTFIHVPKTVNLSATLLTKDPVLHRVQSMMFPRCARYDHIKMKKYITSHACAYQIMDYARSRIQTTEFGSNSYSHVAFERSILKNKVLKPQYLGMISDLANRAYYENRADEDKLAIFVSSRIMAEALLETLQKRWPDLDIRLFMQGSSLKDVLEPDIRITTIISAGTAIDIPNLRCTIMTINIDAPISNAQCLGRLRELKHRIENKDVHFYYTYCSTIPKQVEYHRNKIELFKDRVIEQKNEFLMTLFPFGNYEEFHN